jgi:hypothetical protein
MVRARRLWFSALVTTMRRSQPANASGSSSPVSPRKAARYASCTASRASLSFRRICQATAYAIEPVASTSRPKAAMSPVRAASTAASMASRVIMAREEDTRSGQV